MLWCWCCCRTTFSESERQYMGGRWGMWMHLWNMTVGFAAVQSLTRFRRTPENSYFIICSILNGIANLLQLFLSPNSRNCFQAGKEKFVFYIFFCITGSLSGLGWDCVFLLIIPVIDVPKWHPVMRCVCNHKVPHWCKTDFNTWYMQSAREIVCVALSTLQ